MSATVTMSLTEYDALRGALKEAEKRAAELEEALKTSRTGDAGLTMATLEAAADVVSFAVANMDPLTVAGWPYEKLRAFAVALPKLPIEHAIQERSIAYLQFADEAEATELDRKARKRPVTLATLADFGPQTDEARAVHGQRAAKPEFDFSDG